jgi:hypothetical protein
VALRMNVVATQAKQPMWRAHTETATSLRPAENSSDRAVGLSFPLIFALHVTGTKPSPYPVAVRLVSQQPTQEQPFQWLRHCCQSGQGGTPEGTETFVSLPTVSVTCHYHHQDIIFFSFYLLRNVKKEPYWEASSAVKEINPEFSFACSEGPTPAMCLSWTIWM